MKTEFDWIIIGGGSAGYAAARTAAANGKDVAIVDDAADLGGLCILRGCMPSKTLIYSAEVLHLAQKGKKFGLTIPSANVDMPALQARKKFWVKDFADYRVDQLESDRFTLFRQKGRLNGSGRVTLADGTDLRAGHILLATGSEVSFPAVPGLRGPRTVTSDEVLNWDQLPASVVVLGGGIVACELSQYLLRLGAKVTLIQRSKQVLKDMSPEVSETLLKSFREEGMTVYTGTKLLDIEHNEGGVRVRFEHEGSAQTADGEFLFNALGRQARTADLGLDSCGIELRKNGQVKTSEFQETTCPGVYAAGDCAGPHEIVHVAIMQGELAVNHALGKKAPPVNYDHLLTVVFTDPQVGVVGLSEATAQARGLTVKSADYPFADHGKSLLMEAPAGYVKVVAETESGVVLGAECVGKDAGELIHSMGVAVALGATVADLLKVHWYHPTLSEIWTYPLEDLA
jgi:pyruvate/2-oxoglutarate dehydrogenase complex dihydrolipoamide dehydrogenase (E3) component